MSFELGNAGRGCFYLNFEATGDGTQKAEVTQYFNNANLIDSTGNYMIAVERLVLPTHTIPMSDGGDLVLNFTDNATGNVVQVTTTKDIYSIKEFLEDINDEISGQGFGLLSDPYFAVSASGKLLFNFDNPAGQTVSFNALWQDTFSYPNNLLAANFDANNTYYGEYSFIDRFDQLDRIQLEANGLSVQPEIIDTKTSYEIITDFLPPNTYNFNYSESGLGANDLDEVNVSYPVRQNITYTAESARRFVTLIGFSPVQNVKIVCVAIFKDGTRNEILLPRRSRFTCKIGFYKRS